MQTIPFFSLCFRPEPKLETRARSVLVTHSHKKKNSKLAYRAIALSLFFSDDFRMLSRNFLPIFYTSLSLPLSRAIPAPRCRRNSTQKKRMFVDTTSNTLRACIYSNCHLNWRQSFVWITTAALMNGIRLLHYVCLRRSVVLSKWNGSIQRHHEYHHWL